MHPSKTLVALLVIAGAARANPDAVLKTIAAAAQQAARPLAHRTAGTVSWSKIESTTVAGKPAPLLKVKLLQPLEACLPVMKVLATDPRTNLAGAALGISLMDEEVPIKAGGAARTLRMATLSIEVPLGGKDAAADRRRAQGFALVRRALSSELAKLTSGEALFARQVEVSADGACRIQGRAATPAAVVAALKKLAGETVAGPKPPPVVLAGIRVSKLARDTVDGVEAISVELDGTFADARPGAKPQGFEVLEVPLAVEPAMVAAHAQLGDATLGRIERLEYKPGGVSFHIRSALRAIGDVTKAVEDHPAANPADMMVALSHETKTKPYTDAGGVTRRFLYARVVIVVGTPGLAASGPRKGELAKLMSTLAQIFSYGGEEFVPVASSVPPLPGQTPAPPSPPPDGWRPALRDVRVTSGQLEANVLFSTPEQQTETLEKLAKAGLTDIIRTSERKAPYRDRTVIEVSLKARLSK